MEFTNLVKEKTRHGKFAYYHRVGKGPRTRIRAEFGTPEFARDYLLAENGILPEQSSGAKRPQHAKPGTLRHLIEQYYQSPEYRIEIGETTRKLRRRILDKLCLAGAVPAEGKPPYGERPVALMASRHVRRIRDENSDRPGAANDILKALRRVFSYGIDAEYPGLKFNPVRDVKLLKTKGNGFHAWTIEEVEQFESFHPVGSKARLALALLLYTGQRRSDVVTFGPALINKRGWLEFTQYKNRERKPVHLSLPIISELRSIIDATEVVGAKTWLVTDYGKPFTINGFGNWFHDRCVEAGVPGRAHGLRKATGSRLAELGCTDKEIMAILGHSTAQEVAKYTKAASQRILAASAMEKFSGSEARGLPAPLGDFPRTTDNVLN